MKRRWIEREKIRWIRSVIIGGILVSVSYLSIPTWAIEKGFDKEEVTPVLASVDAKPAVAVLGDGRFYLNYELMLTNAWPVDIALQNLEIVAPDRENKQIAVFNRESIEPMFRLPGAVGPTTTLGRDQSGIVKINLSFGMWQEIPLVIEHLLTVTIEKPYGPFTETEIIEHVARTSIEAELGP